MRLFSLSLLVSLCLGPGTSVRAQTTVSFTGGVNMTSLDLDTGAKLALSPGERVSPHLLVGPALALQSSCQVAVSARQGSASFDSSSNCDGFDLDTKDYDWGLAAGGGLDIGLTDQVDARLGLLYTLGFPTSARTAEIR